MVNFECEIVMKVTSDMQSLNVQQLFNVAAISDPSGPSIKFVVGTLNLSVTLVYLYYTSVFSSVLTTQPINLPFNNLEELVGNREYSVLALNKSGNLELLRVSHSPSLY